MNVKKEENVRLGGTPSAHENHDHVIQLGTGGRISLKEENGMAYVRIRTTAGTLVAGIEPAEATGRKGDCAMIGLEDRGDYFDLLQATVTDGNINLDMFEDPDNEDPTYQAMILSDVIKEHEEWDDD